MIHRALPSTRFLLAGLLVTGSLLMVMTLPGQSFQRMTQEKVELDNPAKMFIKKSIDGDLLADSPMHFSIMAENLPKPVHMWSVQIQYTSPTLRYERTVSHVVEGEMVVNVSEPVNMKEDGWAMQNVAGIALQGWNDGELLRLQFHVDGSAADRATLRLVPHPIAPEGLAHEDLENRRTLIFERELISKKTTNMPVVPRDADTPPHEFPERERRVIYSRD